MLFRSLFSKEPSYVSAIGKGGNHNHWFGLTTGLLIRVGKGLQQLDTLMLPISSNGSVPKITCLLESEGLLLVGTNAGLKVFDLRTRHWRTFEAHSGNVEGAAISTILEDKSGTIWVGTTTLGLNRFNRLFGKGLYRNVAGRKHELSGNHVSSFWLDSDGTLWVGTIGEGLNRKREDTAGFDVFRHDPEDEKSIAGNTIGSILRDRKGTLWVALGADGLNRFNEKDQSFSPVDLGADQGGDFTQPQPRVLVEGVHEELWVGGNHGLISINTASKQINRFRHIPGEKNSLSSNQVRALLTEADGNLWVGTYGGLNYLDREHTTVRHYFSDDGKPDSLSNNRVISIVENPTGEEGVIWLGTWGGGLNRFDTMRQTFVSYREEDGLANDVVYAILPDHRGQLWMSTNKGLSRFDPTTEQFFNWSENDGLQSDEFNLGSALRASDGRMFFGGINGFNVFLPDDLHPNLVPPTPVIESLLFYNHPVLPRWRDPESPLDSSIQTTKKLVLPYKRNFFTLSFSGLHFMDPEKNRYQYKLSGEDELWTEVRSDRRFTSYTNLDPGHYQFQVFAANRDGIWSEEPAEILIHVLRPVWMSNWVIIIYVFVLLVLVFAYWDAHRRARERLHRLVDHRTGQLREKHEALLEAQQALLGAAHNAGMAEIATDVLHNVGNALNSVRISGFMIKELAEKRKSIDFLERLSLLVSQEGTGYAFSEQRGAQIQKALTQTIKLACRHRDSLQHESMRLLERLESMTSLLRAQEKHSQFDTGLHITTDINDLVQGVVRLKRDSLPEDGIELEEHLESVPRVNIDPSKVMRILVYIIKNAIEAIQESGVSQGTVLVCTNSAQGLVVLEVTDNGIGIPPEVLDQVFEQGFSTKGELPGFGLHYSANAMKQMKGNMAIYSRGEGKGTKVTLQFPACD